MNYKRIALVLALCFSASLAFAQDDKPEIVASFTILADVAAQVAGDAANVSSLMPLGTNPHDFIPTPQDLVRLAESDLVLVNGLRLEENLIEEIENAGTTMNIVTVSACIPILPLGFEHAHEHEGEADHDHAEATAEADHDHDHADEHSDAMMDAAVFGPQCEGYHEALEAIGVELRAEHAEHSEAEHNEAEHSEEEHAHVEPLGPLYAVPECASGEAGGCDPHVWTDVQNVMVWTLTIRDALSALDPDNSATYAANAEAYLAQLVQLDAEVIAALAELPEENRVLLTNHETLGYFAYAYDFEVVGVVLSGGSSLAEPSAAELAALIEVVRAEGVTAVFAENILSAALAQQIADESGAQLVQLYSDSLAEEAPTYLEYMRANTALIAAALA